MQGLKKVWLRAVELLRRIRRVRARQPIVDDMRQDAVAAPASEHVLDRAPEPAPVRAPETARERAPKRTREPAGERSLWMEAEYPAPATSETAAPPLAYWLYIPANRGTGVLPLVAMLHGCDQTAEGFAQYTQMNLLADAHRFAVVYPQQPQTAHPYRCWHWYDPGMDKGGGEASRIAALIESLIAQRSIDGSRIYVAGLSAGAGMAALVALRFPSLVAAVGLHSGVVVGEARSAMEGMYAMRLGTLSTPASLLPAAVEDLSSFPGMPAILLHGSSDDVVFPVNTDQLVEQFLMLNGLLTEDRKLLTSPRHPVIETVTQHPLYQQHDYCRDGELKLRVCRIASLEHAWSGSDDGNGSGPEEEPNASALMWEFFSQHRRSP